MGTSFCSGLSFSPHPQPCHQESPPLHLPHPQGSGDTSPLSVTLLTVPPVLQIPDSLQAGKVQEPRPLPSAPTKQTSSLAFHYCQSPKREQIGTGEQGLGLEQEAGLSGPLLPCPGLGILSLVRQKPRKQWGLTQYPVCLELATTCAALAKATGRLHPIHRPPPHPKPLKKTTWRQSSVKGKGRRLCRTNP